MELLSPISLIAVCISSIDNLSPGRPKAVVKAVWTRSPMLSTASIVTLDPLSSEVIS